MGHSLGVEYAKVASFHTLFFAEGRQIGAASRAGGRLSVRRLRHAPPLPHV